jgi:hypothetical protein
LDLQKIPIMERLLIQQVEIPPHVVERDVVRVLERRVVTENDPRAAVGEFLSPKRAG